MNWKPVMAIDLVVQRPCTAASPPSDAHLARWAKAAAAGLSEQLELVIRIVDDAESRTLNRDYRGKDRPTNVLSFPFEGPGHLPRESLGDLVICAPVVAQEAQQQGKSLEAHWAHMVIHGVLHLCGHDHQEDEEATAMEALEVALLSRLGYPDPYGDEACGHP
jgi:probable rRNA maturation factor